MAKANSEHTTPLVTTTSRRTLLSGVIASSALAASGAAAKASVSADPIFSAIENYLAAYSEAERCLEKASGIESELFAIAEAAAQPRMKTRLDFEAAHPDHVFSSSKDVLFSRFRYEELRKLDATPQAAEKSSLQETACDLTFNAAWALVRTVPTSAEGALALMDFIRQREDIGDIITELSPPDDMDDDVADLVSAVMASVGAFIRRTHLS